mmetsp:Transcript_13915/g.52152  ORF Transcript_13915/g.52152 Transcript_13915/m.52152 type:complete len:129 (-) Transcript_13915:138-524(-)
MSDDRAVTFDEAYRVRVLDADTYAQTVALSETARDFCDKVAQLRDTVGAVVNAVDKQAALCEREKLRAVGTRNLLAAEATRLRKDAAVKSAAARERRRTLERLSVEYESLLRVKSEQEVLITRMSGGA